MRGWLYFISRQSTVFMFTLHLRSSCALHTLQPQGPLPTVQGSPPPCVPPPFQPLYRVNCETVRCWMDHIKSAAAQPVTRLHPPPLPFTGAQPGQKLWLFIYLGLLLQKGTLNAMESAELARWRGGGRCSSTCGCCCRRTC